MDHLSLVEYVAEKFIFMYDIDIKEGDFVGQLARRSIDEDEKTVKLIRYSNHIFYVKNIETFFKRFRCPLCDTIFNLSKIFKKHLQQCKNQSRTFTPKCLHTTRDIIQKTGWVQY